MNDTKKVRPARRGMALLLVVFVLASATVMGMAILSTSALQATVSSNSAGIASAEALAESGVNYALYQLELLTEEELMAGEFWSGESDLSLGDDVSGEIDITVTKPDSAVHEYVIESVGHAETSAGIVSRTVRTTVQLNLTFQPLHAAAFNTGLTVPNNTTIVGPMKSSGTVSLANVLKIQGRVRAAQINLPRPSDYEILGVGTPASVPTSFRNYLQYEYDGTTYNAEKISSGTLSNVTYGPNPETNPAGIYWADGAVTLKDNVTINGTLYVKRKDSSSPGRLTLEGTNVVIRAQDGYPALIVEERIRLLGTPKSTTIYGLVWVADGIIRSSLLQSGHALNIYGAFMTANVGTPIDTLFNGTIRLEYSPEYVNVPDFATTNTAPESVKILSWERVNQ